MRKLISYKLFHLWLCNQKCNLSNEYQEMWSQKHAGNASFQLGSVKTHKFKNMHDEFKCQNTQEKSSILHMDTVLKKYSWYLFASYPSLEQFPSVETASQSGSDSNCEQSTTESSTAVTLHNTGFCYGTFLRVQPATTISFSNDRQPEWTDLAAKVPMASLICYKFKY